MPKAKTHYVCQSCGTNSPQWLGQCGGCGEWNTLVEEVIFSVKIPVSVGDAKPVLLSKVKSKEINRVDSGSGEFNRVLGGGFVPGQVILIAGEPGIGKSTLLTQISKNMGNKKVLYVCGEESVGQVKIRTKRMEYKANNLFVLSETDVDAICGVISGESGLDLVIVDSVQAIVSSEYSGVAGSVGQVRGVSQKLTNVAKSIDVPIILVGHVTKEGAVAGPKVLEHIVDSVLYLEGDSQYLYRILKSTKNRFGPVSEVGIFEMTDKGMFDVDSPSDMFISEGSEASPGACVTVVMEGFRPILFEIQALTSRTSFGYPRRTASGFSANRLQVLIAILEKRCGLNLSDQDVYVNVVGGFKVDEYSADLAVCLAIASSLRNKPLKKKTAAFGEVGLSGEVRKVSHADKRVKEAKKLGYTNITGPQNARTVREAVDSALL